MVDIFRLNTITDQELKKRLIEEVKFIFYASSSLKNFESEDRKIAFFKRWCGDYIALYPEEFLVMSENEKVLGYLSGCSNTLLAETSLEVPGLSVFHDLFSDYPAHFHINFHPDCRGRGLGSQIVQRYCNDLKHVGIKGVHVVTSPDAANISFYQRLNFNEEVQRDFKQMTLLFMGKTLE